ncbi:MAG: hypothetical protein PIR53_20590 [Nocardioides alkalitolerans]
MTETAARTPVVTFDHNSETHSEDPAASYRKLREEHPVAWTDAHGGYWVLSGYDAVFEAARDDYTFSSARNSSGGEGLSVVIPKTPAPFHIPIEVDPPEFKKWRKLINPITAPAAVDRMEKIVKHFVTAFIDDIIETGSCDMTSVIGVPAIVTVDWLGCPSSTGRPTPRRSTPSSSRSPGPRSSTRPSRSTCRCWRRSRAASSPSAPPRRPTTSSATSCSRRSTAAP